MRKIYLEYQFGSEFLWIMLIFDEIETYMQQSSALDQLNTFSRIINSGINLKVEDSIINLDSFLILVEFV